MPFVKPTGVTVGSRIDSVANLAKSLSNNDLSHKKNPKPEISCQVKNTWVRSRDDSMHVFTKIWQPVGIPVQSVVVFVHDVLEHCERYHSLFVQFAIKGIEVHSFDLPGFGETGARTDSQGRTGGYNTLLKEVDSAIDRASNIHSAKPLFLVGHGMGGTLVLNYVCGLGQRITALAGVVSSSPYLKPTLVGAGARFPSTYNRLGKWYPNISVKFQVLSEELTRDPAEQDRHQGDGLIQESVSLQCLGDMIYQGNKLLEKRWKKFPKLLPTLLLHGSGDPIASYQATTALSNKLLKLQPINFVFKSWRGSKHDRTSGTITVKHRHGLSQLMLQSKANDFNVESLLAHWDIDAIAVRNEYIQWIRDISRHFDKVPLDDSMVHSDSIKSVRSRDKNKRSGKVGPSDVNIAAKSDNGKSKGQPKNDDHNHQKEDKKLSKAEKRMEQEHMKQRNESNSTVNKENIPKTPISAVEKPEGIQDLKDLLRQQQLKQEKAKAKRVEYELDDNGGEKAALTATSRPFTVVATPAPGLPVEPAASQVVTTPLETENPEKDTTGSAVDNPPETIQPLKIEGAEGTHVQEDESFVPDTTLCDTSEPPSEDMNQDNPAVEPSTEGISQENSTSMDLEVQESDHHTAAEQIVDSTNAGVLSALNVIEEIAVTDAQESILQVHTPSSLAENSNVSQNNDSSSEVVERTDV